ncbi:twin-arginine translocase TatA/TatE family subunit [Microbacterium sp. ZW T5_45]|uniref:twin-arginine translocase TatA/TatE family subunit n=1 Tax=Microbacterium sp. ZW T5_45 TaxID=3378080 RepID=UPI003852E5C1
MFQNLTGWHALIILAIVVLVFGAAKLPALARSVGQSLRILRSESAEQDAGTSSASASQASAESVASSPLVAETSRPAVRVAE